MQNVTDRCVCVCARACGCTLQCHQETKRWEVLGRDDIISLGWCLPRLPLDLWGWGGRGVYVCVCVGGGVLHFCITAPDSGGNSAVGDGLWVK